MSAISPISPLERKDIRSDAQASKRDKEHSVKWAHGITTGSGVRVNIFPSLPDQETADAAPLNQKIRPLRPFTSTLHKSHANKTPKVNSSGSRAEQQAGKAAGRLASKNAAIVDASNTSSELSRSLLELAPQHANNTNSAIQTAVLDLARADGDVLYSFDNKGPSPGVKGRKVDLGGLVEQAEKKWVEEKTEKIVKGEYEILDGQGEVVTLKGKKRSPKQKAKRDLDVEIKGIHLEDDDGFELV